MTFDRESKNSVPLLDQQLETSLDDIGIPPRPRILELIVLETRKSDPDLNHMADLIRSDVALAAGLIKTANSPFFGYKQKTRNVRDAITMLGMRNTTNAVAGLVLRHVFPLPPQLTRFWDASERTAQLAAWLVNKVGVRFGVTPDEAYTFALFRDCGIPIMMRRFPDYVAALEQANHEAELAFTAAEETQFPTNHAVVGTLMVQSWWLPEELCLAIRYHHDAVALAEGGLIGASSRQIALAQLAEKLHQEISNLNVTREWDKLGASSLRLLDLGDTVPEELVEEAKVFLEGLAEY